MAIRRAEVIFVGDAASIVRAAKQAEAASAQTAEAAKRAGADTAAANKTAGDSADASATKQVAAHKRTTAAISGTATAMTKLTAPILLAAGAGAKFAMDFQAQMERVHTQANVSQKAVAELSKGVLGMSGAVAQAPQALADGIYHVASSLNATLPAATAVSTELRVMKVAAEGATVGHANLVDVTNALDAAVVSGIKGIQNYTQGMGALNAIVGAGDMKMQDLADALGTGILGPMKTFGLSLKDVGGALAVFGDNNIRGQDAATKLTSAVRIMAAPSKAAAKELATIGLSTLQLANDMRSGGIVKALADLKQHLQDSGDTASQQGLIISRAFGGRQSTGVQLLLGQLDRLKAKTGEVSAGAQGFAAAWTATQGTAAFKMQSALATMKADLTSFGTAVLPPLLAAGAAITGAVDHVAKAFSSLPGGAQKAIITGGLILAGIGPAMKILGVFSSSIAKMWQIAQLISGTKVIGGPAGGGAASAGSAAAGAEGAATSGVGAVRSIASRALGGAAIGGLGVLLSQTIGSSIHGAVGKAVKTIGTDTSIGAGVGAIFGPLGMAGGALIGGVVGSISNFISNHAAQQGKEWAQKFTVDLPNQIGKKTADAVAQTATKVRATAKPGSTLANIQSGANPYSSILGHAPVGHPSANPYASILNPGGTAGTDPKMLAQQTAALTKAYFAEGQAAGKAVVAGMKSVKDPSQGILLSDFTMQLQKLPAEAKPQAAKVMLNFATGLQQGGKISLKALEDIVRGIEGQIPGLASYMQYEGQVTAKQLIETMKFTQATSTLKNTLAGYRKQFGDMAISTSITGQNIDQNITTAMSHLHTIVATTTGKTRTDAVNTLQRMHDQVTSLFDTMGGKVQASIKSMGDAIKSGSASAAKVASANLSDFAANVGQAMQNGVVSVGQGMKLIIDNTNKALKEMGQKQLSPIQVSSLTLGTAKQRNLKAGGGYIGNPGEKGRDNVPIVVGRGEAILNHDQQKVVNGALSAVGIGGLPSLFSKVNRPHYMASGGIVTASEYGGPSDHTVSQTHPIGYRGDNLLQHPDSYAELNMGTALGGLPYMAPLNVTYHGKTARLFKRDIGAGGPGLNGHTRAIDLWFQAANSLGFNGLGDVTVGGSGGVNVKISGGSGGAGGSGSAALANIMAPKVGGTGVMATIANSAMKILAKGANAFLGTKTPAGVTVGGGGGAFPAGGGATSGPGGLATFEGVTMSQWIANELSWATKHGWHGQPTSGYRPGFDPHAPSGSEHALIAYPGGAVDFGGMTGDPAAYATKLALVQLAARLNYPGPRLMMPQGFQDDGHLSGDGHAKGGFVGSFKNGGVVPRTGLALVHKNETVIPAFASGGAVGGGLKGLKPALGVLGGIFTTPTPGINIGAIVSGIMGGGLLYPIDSAITALTALAAKAKNPVKINLEIQNLTQLKNFKDAIASLGTQMDGLAQQAAQAWQSIQTDKINAAHTAAIAAIQGGTDATTLAAMQAQDTADANAAQLAALQATLATDQGTAANSGGQTHLDALAQVKADQAAIDAFNRQQTEDQLQANIDAATQKADDAQQAALDGLTQQTADYQSSLDAQLQALTASLDQRKITYATWAADVDAILQPYGLSASTDPTTEGTISAGPTAPTNPKAKAAPKPVSKKKTGKSGITFGGARAMGGGVQPGYVYRVGEQGPEDVVFGQSGTVHTAAQTRSGGMGGGVHIHGDLVMNGARSAAALADRLAYRAAIGTA